MPKDIEAEGRKRAETFRSNRKKCRTKNRNERKMDLPRNLYGKEYKIDDPNLSRLFATYKMTYQTIWKYEFGKPAQYYVCRPGISKHKNTLKEQLGLPPSDKVKVTGYTHVRYGNMPQEFSAGDPFAREYFMKNNPSEYASHSETLRDFLVIHPSYSSNHPNIQAMCEDHPYTGTYTLLQDTVDAYGAELLLPQLTPPTIDDLNNVSFNPEANPGLITGIRCKASKKIKCYEFALARARKLFRSLSKKFHPNVSPYILGGRSRRKRCIEGKVLKARHVYMEEFENFLFASLYIDPITERIGIHGKGPLSLGQSLTELGYERYSDYFGPCGGNTAEVDWSGFDEKIVEELIVTSFGLLRSCYPKSNKIDNHFLYMLSGFLFKTVVLPNGYILQIRKGIPSGHGATTLIGSLVNFLMWRSSVYTLYGKVDWFRSIHGGDDTLYGIINNYGPQDKKLTTMCEKIKDKATELWAGVIKEELKFGYINGPHTTNTVSFLGQYQRNGLTERSINTYLELLIYPEKRPRNIYERVEKITGLLFNSPYNIKARCNVLEPYRRFLFKTENKEFDPTGTIVLSSDERISGRENYSWGYVCTKYERKTDLGNPGHWLGWDRKKIHPSKVPNYFNIVRKLSAPQHSGNLFKEGDDIYYTAPGILHNIIPMRLIPRYKIKLKIGRKTIHMLTRSRYINIHPL